VITLSGAALTPIAVGAVVDRGLPVDVDPAARERAAASQSTVRDVLTRRPVYGRSTGVGANLGIAVTDGAGLRLLRSHAGGAGPLLAARPARAMIVVRANQLLAGAAGVDPALIDALVAAVNTGAHPSVPAYGSIGMGDLTALAVLALTLTGERPWIGTGPPPFAIDDLDALALLSSSALTIGQASLAYLELARLADAATVIAALSFTAVQGSPEPFAAEVQAARPHAGAVAVAARMRELVEPVTATSARVQDPYGLRTLSPVHGVLIDSLHHLGEVLAVELNAGAENPLVSAPAGDVFHHGNFHQAPLAVALDTTRLALLASAQLGVTRLGALMKPRLTGLAAFLADGPAGSSGLLITEYAAASALAAIRAAANPVTGGNAVVSRGAEEHASFAPQGVAQTQAAIEAYRVVLAAELIAVVRAIALSKRAPAGPGLLAAYMSARDSLPTETDDRPLDSDFTIAVGLLDSLGRAESTP
jgi:histidine ammonia-lyase